MGGPALCCQQSTIEEHWPIMWSNRPQIEQLGTLFMAESP